MDGALFAAAVFTNLSQDHLDYHRNLDDYFAAKSRLFMEILANGRPSPGLAVLNLDDPRGRQLKDAVGARPSPTASIRTAWCGP